MVAVLEPVEKIPVLLIKADEWSGQRHPESRSQVVVDKVLSEISEITQRLESLFKPWKLCLVQEKSCYLLVLEVLVNLIHYALEVSLELLQFSHVGGDLLVSRGD